MTHTRRAHHGPRQPTARLPQLTLLLLCLGAGAPRAQEAVLAARARTEATAPRSAARLQAQLAETEVMLDHDLGATIELAQGCVALAQESGDTTGELRALTMLARAQAKTLGKAAAMASLQRATELRGDVPQSAVDALLGRAYALVHWSFDELPDCLTRLRRAMYDAEEAGDPRLMLLCELEAINVAGFSEEPLAVLDRLDQAVRQLDDPLLALELALLRADALIRKNEQEQVEALLRKVQNDARRLGSRSAEAIATSMLSRLLSDDDPNAALQLVRRSIATARAHGDREILALGLQGEAYLCLHLLDLDRADAAIEECVATFEAMQMHARLYRSLETAAAVASARDDEAALKAVSNRRLELDRLAAEHEGRGESDRFWRETEHLRLDMRTTQRRHEAELARMNDTLTRWLFAGGAAALLLGGTFTALLLRAKRRLQTANTQLVDQIDAAERAKEAQAALENNLRQRERLDSLGLLAGGFAHDFNNILVGVKGNAQLLLLDPHLDGARRDPLEQIVAASDRAARMCKDILTYARTGGEERAVLDLRDVVSGLLPIARAGFGAGIEVTLALGDQPCNVQADRGQLEQLFLNLLTNAHEAIGERGRIRIEITHRTLPGTPPTGHWFGEFTGEARECVALSVVDTGQGMDAATIRRIFDPFFSTRFPGRGIGLAAAFGILRRHHGVIQVQSEPGEGSSFDVFLPRAQATASRPTAAPAAVVEPPPVLTATDELHVLVVDDEPSVGNVVERTLARHGMAVTVTDSGDAALKLLDDAGARFDLAVIDFTMPDMDGAALSAAIRSRLPELPIVLMSGHDEAMVRSAATGCAFLGKPFDAAELVRVVAQVTRQRLHGATKP